MKIYHEDGAIKSISEAISPLTFIEVGELPLDFLVTYALGKYTISGGVIVENSDFITPLPIDNFVITAEQKLAQAQLTQIVKLRTAYIAAIQLPVVYMGSTFQADSDSQDILTKCLVAGSVPIGFYWLDVNNVQVPMTFAQLQGLATTMLAQGQIAFTKLQDKKTAVRAALTVADVQAVVWILPLIT
jgi:hypothetical protein